MKRRQPQTPKGASVNTNVALFKAPLGVWGRQENKLFHVKHSIKYHARNNKYARTNPS